jgi:hypothetical protein
MRRDTGADDAVAHAHHGMSDGRGRRHGRDRYYSHARGHNHNHTHNHDHDSDHDGAACAYCPLLAGLVQWASTPPWRGAAAPAVAVHAPAGPAPAARIQRDTLGARGPPVRGIA